MTYRLPPLNSLRLFEVAARRQSFKEAASELQVTPGAVSHGIRNLEDWLGLRLFVRTGRGMTLTAAGVKYLPSVQAGLELLSNAANKIPGRRAQNSIRISAPPTFAARIILPRLEAFSKRNPAIRVALSTEFRHVEFPRDGIDIAIRMGRDAWPGFSCTKLFNETLVPVCSPALRATLDLSTDLLSTPLIHLTSASEDWKAWANATGKPFPDQTVGIKVDTIQLAMDAAIRGMGIAIGRLPIIDVELKRERLVTLGLPPAESKIAYWLVTAESEHERPDIADFSEWLLGEIEKLRTDRR